MSIGLDAINDSSETRFVELLGSIFEHSPWVAQQVYSQRPFQSRADLLAAMTTAVRRASKAQRLKLLCNHPELAGKEAKTGTLTDDSQREQAGAGLNQCSIAELQKIQSLNKAYLDNFGFPFIIAVTGLDKFQIIAAMQRRLDNSKDREFDTALGEVEKIGQIRIEALVDG